MAKSKKTVEEELCPVADEAAVAAAEAYMRELAGAPALRRLMSRMLVRIDALEKSLSKLARIGTGESRRLKKVDWQKRRSDAHLSFVVPGATHVHRMRLGTLYSEQNCALCGVDLHPGMQSYHAGWTSSSWLRHLRVCYECGQREAPAPKAEDLVG